MRRFLKLGLPCVLLVVLAPTLWSLVTTHGDLFDSQNLLRADAAALKTTWVSPHLETPIQDGANVVWCGTFQLAWNELCGLVGEDLHFAGQEPEMVPFLNTRAFRKDDLDDASYVALVDFVCNDIHGQISRALFQKFHGQASPKCLPSRTDTPRPQDIVAYSYLFKSLEFDVVFERIEQLLTFGESRVSCFGIGDVYKSGQTAMHAQVVILDYQTPDDFIIELRTKSNDDRLILAKTRPGTTLQETIAAIHERMERAKPALAAAGDVLKVPRLNFDITRNYTELLGAKLATANPNVAKDLQIVAAAQNTRFQMDEKGVKLKSDSQISIGCSAPYRPPLRHVMVFDKPFLIIMQRSDAKTPYLALWIGNAELLQQVD